MNRFEMAHCGSGVAIIGVGNFFALAVTVAEQLKQSGIDATVVNPRFLTGLDTERLEDLRDSHSLVVTLEDGVLDGGYGEKIARYYGESRDVPWCSQKVHRPIQRRRGVCGKPSDSRPNHRRHP